MDCLCLVCILLLTLSPSCHGLIRSRTKQYASLGDTVLLNCNDTLHATSLGWRRKEQILSDGRTIGSHFEGNERMQITGDFSLGEYHLQIINISTTDSDTYTCEAAINKTTYQREVVLTIQEFIQLTTMHAKLSGTTVIIGSTTTATTKTTTTGHFASNDSNNILPKKDDDFLKYALYVVGLISVLALSIACSMCLYKCLKHRTKRHIQVSPKAENVVEQSNNIVDLAVEENLNDYEVIQEDAMVNLRDIYSRATNASSNGNSEHPVYLEIVEDIRSNDYQPAVDIEPSERHNYEKPMQREIEKSIQTDETVVKELHSTDENSKESTTPKQRVQKEATTEF